MHICPQHSAVQRLLCMQPELLYDMRSEHLSCMHNSKMPVLQNNGEKHLIALVSTTLYDGGGGGGAF